MAPDMMEWQWSDGSSWHYWNDPWKDTGESGYDCVYSQHGSWFSLPCEKDACGGMSSCQSIHVVCANPPTRMSGNHNLVFGKAALINPNFRFWWNSIVEDDASQLLGFKIDWKIYNPRKPMKKTFVTKAMSGNVSSPGLGSQATIEHYKGTQEYNAVIELPHNITEIIGNGTFTIFDEGFSSFRKGMDGIRFDQI